MHRRRNFMKGDMTTGKPEAVLWKFCLPLFASIIFQQLYNIADSFVAGKFINNNALAAVGNSYEITLIFIAFAFGCNIGGSVVAAQFFGAKKYESLKTAVWTTFIAGGVLCAVLMIAGFICQNGLLHLINTPDVIFRDSKLYLDIYMLGLPFVFFYNIATGFFAAMGDSKTPFIFLACSSVSNIAVDILFVAGLKMGVSGVAWATFICQGVSCILAVVVIWIKLKKIKTQQFKIFSFKILRKILIIAVPSILQQSFISVGNIIIQGVINGFGASVIAGYSAAIKLNNMVITALSTLANGISNYTAQNIGAKMHARIKDGFKTGIKMVWTLCLPIVLVYLIFSRQLIYIFMDSFGGEAMKTGTTFIKITAPFYFIISAKLVADGILRGAGFMKRFMASTFTDLLLRVFLSKMLSKTALGVTGVWVSWPIGWSVAAVMSVVFYLSVKWEKTIEK